MNLVDKHWFVYILTNYPNTVLYIGITNNLQRRILEHKSGLSNRAFTKRYRLYKLVWFESFPSPEEAIVVEKKVKGWSRDKKLNLIKKGNPNFQDIASVYK